MSDRLYLFGGVLPSRVDHNTLKVLIIDIHILSILRIVVAMLKEYSTTAKQTYMTS
jgi:hypothetical protein